MKEIRLEDLEVISATEVPMRRSIVTVDWISLFEGVPVGKAIVIPRTLIPNTTVRGALVRMQKKGRFQNYYVAVRNSHKETETT